MSTKRELALMVIGLLVATGLVAATVQYHQTLQGVSAVIGIVTNCGSPTANITSVTVNTTGWVYWRCASNTAPAFKYLGGTPTPSFTIGTVYKTLYVFTASTAPPAAGSCLAAEPGAIGLTNNTVPSPVLTPNTSYSYCTDYAAVPATGLPALPITWTVT